MAMAWGTSRVAGHRTCGAVTSSGRHRGARRSRGNAKGRIEGGTCRIRRDIRARAVQKTQLQSWTWTPNNSKDGGYSINHQILGDGKVPILLVHGFGASIGHWKKNIPALVEAGFKVHAIDLLGFGKSEKPLEYEYTMEGWRDLLIDYIEEFVSEPALIMGNSIGSLASVMVASSLPSERIRGVVLVNCAGGMNNTATLDDDWRIKLISPIIFGLNSLLKVKPVGRFLFDKFRTKENVEGILKSVYCNEAAVDEDLVDLLYEPSCDKGALEAFVSIITGPPGPRPEPLIKNIDSPILLLWGDKDPFTPIDGPVGKFFQNLPSSRAQTTLEVLADTGHCPHDDRPEVFNERLIPWLQSVI